VVQVRDVLGEFDVLFQQPQRPPGIPRWRLGTCQGDQPGLDLTGHRGRHRRKVTLLARDRGEHIAAGFLEPLGDQSQHLARDPEPGRDHFLRIGLTHRGVQRE
jgi:hypothetical protein